MTPTTHDQARDAITAHDQARDALTAIDRVRDAWAMWGRDADEQGQADAYRHAHTLIARASGDTP